MAELRQGKDSTLEVEPELLAEARHLTYTDQLADIAACNVYIVTVPTPIVRLAANLPSVVFYSPG